MQHQALPKRVSLCRILALWNKRLLNCNSNELTRLDSSWLESENLTRVELNANLSRDVTRLFQIRLPDELTPVPCSTPLNVQWTDMGTVWSCVIKKYHRTFIYCIGTPAEGRRSSRNQASLFFSCPRVRTRAGTIPITKELWLQLFGQFLHYFK